MILFLSPVEPPKFVTKLESTKLLMIGNTVTLECKVTGSPPVNIQWFKNDTEISSNEKYQMTFANSVATFKMVNCSTDDSGSYICMASNDAGSDRCSSVISVKGVSFSPLSNYRIYNSVLIYRAELISCDHLCF